jgi:hypothetical protein
MIMDINEADKKVHPVETQWHHPIMTKYGYVPDTKEAVGFVRSYTYTHPGTGHSVIATTGYSADYWNDMASKKSGYWRELEPHLLSLQEASQ